MILRPVHLDEVTSLSELARVTYADAFGHTFSASDLAVHLETNLSDAHFRRALDEDIILVAGIEDQLVGFVQFGTVAMPAVTPSPKDQELRRLYVRSEFQNRAIGTRLLEAALSHPRLKAAENIYLDVWERNLGAQKLYRRYGFEVIGAHALPVASGVAADQDLIMVRRSENASETW